MLKNIVLISSVSCAISLSAQAGPTEIYSFSEAEGFSPLNHCQLEMDEAKNWPSVQELRNSVAQMTGIAPMELEDGTPVPLEKSLWLPLLTAEGNHQVTTCFTAHGPREYINFEVIVPENPELDLIVSLSREELGLFENAELYPIEVLDELVDGQYALQAETHVSKESLSLSKGSLDYVVCTSSRALNVRDEKLSQIRFKARRFESVKKVQSFGVDEQQRRIGGRAYPFIKVEFSDRPRSQRLGWVASEFVKLRSECPGADAGAIDDSSMDVHNAHVTGSWVFPLIKRPTHSYRTGARKYAAGRSGGRLHAACDLYRVKNEAVKSASSGRIVRDLYFFYQGTYALEVKHTDGRVVRYGEITGKRAPGVGLNRSVPASHTLGYIGKVNSGCCNPMLHFEMYTGRGSGPLSQRGNKFRRRWDLMDPTANLRAWEKQKFGASH